MFAAKACGLGWGPAIKRVLYKPILGLPNAKNALYYAGVPYAQWVITSPGNKKSVSKLALLENYSALVIKQLNPWEIIVNAYIPLDSQGSCSSRT